MTSNQGTKRSRLGHHLGVRNLQRIGSWSLRATFFVEANPRQRDNGRRSMRDKSWTSSLGSTEYTAPSGEFFPVDIGV